MEEINGNGSQKDGDDAVRNHGKEGRSRDYADSRDDRSNRASSSRQRYNQRNKRGFYAHPPQGSYDMSGGYGFDASYGPMNGMPFDPSFDPQWNMNNMSNFTPMGPMPFMNADAYMNDPSAYQVPRKRYTSKKPKYNDKDRGAESALSDHSSGKDRSKGHRPSDRADDKDGRDEEDVFERLNKRRRNDEDEWSDKDVGKRREDRGERRYARDSSAGRRREEAQRRPEKGEGTSRQRDYRDRKNKDDGWNDEEEESIRAVDRQKDQEEGDDEEVPRRRARKGDADDDDRDRNGSHHRSKQRERRSRSIDDRGRRSPSSRRRDDTRAKTGREGKDEEETYSQRQTPSYNAWRSSRDERDQQNGSFDRRRERDNERGHDNGRKFSKYRERNETSQSYERRERIREREEQNSGWRTQDQPIVPVTPPREGLLPPSSQREESREAKSSQRRQSRHAPASEEERRWRDHDDPPRRPERRTPPRRRSPTPPRRSEISLSDRYRVLEDQGQPSDAMQAAMEAALGVSLKTIGSDSSNLARPPSSKVAIEEQEESAFQGPLILRARPDEVYEQVAQVGEGTYGQVFKAKSDKTGVIVALKKIRMESEKDGFPITALREIKILQGLRHENVVRLHEMLLSKNSIYMVFEYLEHDLNGILSQSSIQFTAAHLKSLAKQLLAGLAYLHHHSILHRDLKGSNLLLHRDGTLKLADFGLARRYTKRVKNNLDYTNRVVTLWYRPPELLFGETCYNDAIDVWGAGCIFLELFTRKPVFQGNDEIHQVQVLFDLLGPIEKHEWPEADTLPWYDLVRPIQDEQQNSPAINGTFRKSRLYSLLTSLMPVDALEIAAALLSYNPTRRVSATGALQMDYFARNLPSAEKPRAILESVTGEWHEFESRQARRSILAPVDTQQVPGSADSVSRLTVNNGQMGPPDTVASQGRGRAEKQAST